MNNAMVARYGKEAPYVIASSLLNEPWEPVAPGIDVTRAEFRFAIAHEEALAAAGL